MTAGDDAPALGTPRVATGVGMFLGEGPLWDPIRGVLLWVDIEDGSVYRGVFAFGGSIEIQERIAFPDTAGTVAVAASGEMVVAGTRSLFFRAPDGAITAGPDLVSGEGRRFNDGKPDPQGRLVVGTKGPDGSDAETLLRVEHDGSATVLDDDLTLANGLGWTADGRRLYTVDTLSRRIHVRDYDPDTGETGPRRVFLTLDGPGYPDGMTIDAEDHLWVAVWGGGRVLRISPAGEIVGRIDVPAPHTSSVAFAGPELDTMVITTAQENLTPEELAAAPLSGRLFTLRPGVRGTRPLLWAGRS
ncbi:SMP-30/gluconolactonase/LRE family protein [Microbacterium sp.]|uniref:SMP-30/gluconolactonase/LRE family protein n=1 Tax=Microbacterium sp. TaxID=51671 RepID=UPI0025D37DDE|nr:SMP-30/gluconolactonase/LRE family protein [Microbacterium sp.]